MSAQIPDTHVDLLNGPVFAVLTTISPSGGPENTIVWCSWDGTHVLVNTAEGRRKPQNVRANPKVALTALDPEDAYRWIDVRGVVEDIVPDPDLANINAHTKGLRGSRRVLRQRYAGLDEGDGKSGSSSRSSRSGS